MIQRLFIKHKHLLRRTLSIPKDKVGRETRRAMVLRGEQEKVVMKMWLAQRCLVVRHKSTGVTGNLDLQYPIYKI